MFSRCLPIFSLLLLTAPLQVHGPPTFAVASPELRLTFPRDHGEHPDFETEWWYLTGQLTGVDQNLFSSPPRYGFQLTFFRRAVVTGEATSQAYLAHAALSDIRTGTFHTDKRLSSGGIGLAGAASTLFRVFHLDWLLELIGQKLVVHTSVPVGENRVELRLISEAIPAPLLHGESGFSRKATCAGCASMYYSFPRLKLTGQLVRGGSIEPLHGLGWFDHEFMTNALTKDQEGWDWFSLMLEDGTDLMLFQLRANTSAAAYAAGTLRRGPRTVRLAPTDFTLTPREHWISPRTGARYPTSWNIAIPAENLTLEVRTLVADQEFATTGTEGITYYEGAVRSVDGRAVGYVEMTGYAGAIEGAL